MTIILLLDVMEEMVTTLLESLTSPPLAEELIERGFIYSS